MVGNAIASAVLPTIVANTFFLPTHLLPKKGPRPPSSEADTAAYRARGNLRGRCHLAALNIDVRVLALRLPLPILYGIVMVTIIARYKLRA